MVVRLAGLVRLTGLVRVEGPVKLASLVMLGGSLRLSIHVIGIQYVWKFGR